MPIIEPILREIASDSSGAGGRCPIAQAPDYRRQCANCERFSAAMSRLYVNAPRFLQSNTGLLLLSHLSQSPAFLHTRARHQNAGAVGDAALAARAAAARWRSKSEIAEAALASSRSMRDRRPRRGELAQLI